MEIEQIGNENHRLGEGPLWDPVENVLYGVDVTARSVWRYDPATSAMKKWQLPDAASSLALRESGGAVVTLSDGFYEFDFDGGECQPICNEIETDLPTRFNDGKVDRQGRFVAGTMHHDISEPIGNLYRLNGDRTVSVLDTDIYCSNGPCWSLDGRTFYFTDTRQRQIFAYDYDIEMGDVANKRVFVDIKPTGIKGSPDGCTVDGEDYLWSALCVSGKIARFAPDGTLDRVIDMPVLYVSSVMFGGENLDVLYVTTISDPLGGRAPKEENAGGLFAVHGLGVSGVPEPRVRM